MKNLLHTEARKVSMLDPLAAIRGDEGREARSKAEAGNTGTFAPYRSRMDVEVFCSKMENTPLPRKGDGEDAGS